MNDDQAMPDETSEGLEASDTVEDTDLGDGKINL